MRGEDLGGGRGLLRLRLAAELVVGGYVDPPPGGGGVLRLGLRRQHVLRCMDRDGVLDADDRREAEAAAAAGRGARNLPPVPAVLLPAALPQRRLAAPQQVPASGPAEAAREPAVCAGCEREQTPHSRFGRDDRSRGRIYGRADGHGPAARGPGILRGYLPLNLCFLAISQNLGLYRLFFTTEICISTSVRDGKGDSVTGRRMI